MDLITLGYEVSMYNYGKPRVGNKEYAEFCSKSLIEKYRHVHFKDIIPHLPHADVWGGYRHSTTEVFEDKDSSVILCSSKNGEDPSCSDQFWFGTRET